MEYVTGARRFAWSAATCGAIRAPAIWPSVLLFGFVVVAVLSVQMDGPAATHPRIASGMLWLAVFFAGTLSMEHSFAGEREDGCWDALRLYPVAPSIIFIAKLLFNFIVLSGLTVILIPLFAVLCNAPLLSHPGAMLAVTFLANLGLAAAGTLIAALTIGPRKRSHLTALLLLPLVLPVLLGAGDATRLLMAGELDEYFWRWLQLLAAFTVIFITVGVLACDFILED